MNARPQLSIDAGQTTMKVRVISGDHEHNLTFPGIRTDAPLLPQLAVVASEAATMTGVRPEIMTAGVSGLTLADSDPAALAAMLRVAGIAEAVLAHDSTTSFLGALGDQQGVVVAAGTGVVTLAAGATHVARVDGWGNIMGDAGSGYWVGREALDAVMRAFDGRGQATALTDVVQARWPVLPDAYIELQGADDRVRLVASIAADVARLADSGDRVAVSITTRAAQELAHSAITGLRLVGELEDPQARVCAIGGIFQSTMLLDAFVSSLRTSGLHQGVVAPLGDGLDGAVALASLPAGHAFESHLVRASVAVSA